MSPRLKIIAAMAILALAVGLKLATTAPPDETDIAPAFYRMGLVFGLSALALAVAWIARPRHPRHSSMVTGVFLFGTIAATCIVIVAERLFGLAV